MPMLYVTYVAQHHWLGFLGVMYPVSGHCVSCLCPPETARLQDVLQSQARELDKANKVGSSVGRGLCVGVVCV